MDVHKEIGYRLRRARKRANLTQDQVMRALGFRSANRISQWEAGTRVPSVKNLLKLSVLYKTLPDDLFYELRQEAVSSIEQFLKAEFPGKPKKPPT